MIAKRIELIAGLVTGAVTGVAVLVAAAALLVINSASGAYPPGGSVSSARTLLFLGLIGLGGLGTALGAYLHAARALGAALGLLWLAAGLLLLLAIAGLFSIGIVILPGALLAVIAAVAGSRAQAEAVFARRAPRPSRP